MRFYRTLIKHVTLFLLFVLVVFEQFVGPVWLQKVWFAPVVLHRLLSRHECYDTAGYSCARNKELILNNDCMLLLMLQAVSLSLSSILNLGCFFFLGDKRDVKMTAKSALCTCVCSARCSGVCKTRAQNTCVCCPQGDANVACSCTQIPHILGAFHYARPTSQRPVELTKEKWTGPKRSIYVSTKISITPQWSGTGNEAFWKWNGKLRSDRTDRSKRTTSGGGPLFPENFHLDRSVPFRFRLKFPGILA